MSKKSIRFFNDREVRAVWDEEHNKWWFSATDIVRAINDEEDYKKCRNYWKYLKGKMAKENIQLVSVTNHFKFVAPDGKQRLKLCVDWSKINKKDYLEAMRKSTTNANSIRTLLQGAMTDRIDDREIFMKGIDYSYYYEKEE